MCLSGGQKIKQGDIISVRGYGKFLVEDLGKTSKKRPSVYYVGDLSIGGIYDYTSEVLGKELRRGLATKQSKLMNS